MKTIWTIVKELASVCDSVSAIHYQDLVSLLEQDQRFFFFGEGRSGLIMKAVAMRLMHAGKNVFVVGETITPSIRGKDILIVMSGSGTTSSTTRTATQATKVGAEVFLITADEDALHSSPFHKGLVIPAATKSKKHVNRKTIQPLGNQFDQAAHLILDAAVIDATQETSHEAMKQQHSNLE